MKHIVLLGDSIFDNGAYVNGGPDVVTQLKPIKLGAPRLGSPSVNATPGSPSSEGAGVSADGEVSRLTRGRYRRVASWRFGHHSCLPSHIQARQKAENANHSGDNG
jgi:hypothetical protein